MLPRMLTLFVAMAVVLPQVAAGASPRLEVSPKEYNFGEVQFGNQATTRFTVRNMGEQALVIDRVRTTCGCTKAKLSISKLFPKESADLTVEFDSSGLKAGKKVKTVILESSGQTKPVAKVNVFATVVRELIVEPGSLVTRLTGDKDQVEFSLTARNRSTKPVTMVVSSVQGSLKDAVLTPKKVVIPPDSESRATIRLKLAAKDNPKYFKGRVILETNHSKEKWIGLPYFIKVHRAK